MSEGLDGPSQQCDNFSMREPTRLREDTSLSTRGRTADAVAILHRRYIGEDAVRKASLEEERILATIERQIFEQYEG
jgi:hypothetical protein